MPFFIITSAFAAESTPQIFLMQEYIPLLQDVEQDTGWLPADGNLSVRFQVLANGGVFVQQEGSAELSWGEEPRLALSLLPQRDPYETDQLKLGMAELNSELEVVLSLRFSIFQFDWEQDFTLESISFGDSKSFTPFLLDEQLYMSGSAQELHFFQTDLSPFPGVDLFFRVEMEPQTDLTLEGVHWEIESYSDSNQFIESPDEFSIVTPQGLETHEVTGHYVMNADLDLQLVFSPVFEVCVPLAGCFEWEISELPATAFQELVEHNFAPQDWSFPQPLSTVYVGEQIVLGSGTEQDEAVEILFEPLYDEELLMQEVLVENSGALPLQIEAVVDEDSQFSVFPQHLTVEPYSSSGVVVSYLAREQDSSVDQDVLVLRSNDPLAANRIIGLNAFDLSDPADAGENQVDSDRLSEGESVLISRGCGCSSTLNSVNNRQKGLLLLGLIPLFAFRRYRV